MNSIAQQQLINGDFAKGDLTGWTVTDPAFYRVMPYADDKNCLVQLSAPREQSIAQSVAIGPGTYQLGVWHRATDEQGQPVDKTTVSGGALHYDTPDGGKIIPLVLFSSGEWSKWTVDFVIRRNDSTIANLFFQNIDNSVRKALQAAFQASLGLRLEETPVSLRDIEIWQVR